MYIIPLIIFLIVLIILKKRQDATQTEPENKKSTTAQKSSANKKTSSSKVKQTKQEDISENTSMAESQTTPTAIRDKIQSLIRDRQFFAAEALINQSLKNNSAYHELYLLLLDVHLLQNDSFAVDQLIHHLQSLELHEILKQVDHRISLQKEKDSLQGKTPYTATDTSGLEASHVKNTNATNHAFDALISTSKSELSLTPSQTTNTPLKNTVDVDFQPLQSVTHIGEEKDTSAELKLDMEPLEFQSALSESKTEVIATNNTHTPHDEVKPLEFTFTLQDHQEKTETAETHVVNEPKDTTAIDPLIDLNPSIHLAEVTIAEPKTEEIKLDFAMPDFSLENHQEHTQQVEVSPLKSSNETIQNENVPHFDLDFEPTAFSTHETPTEIKSQSTDLTDLNRFSIDLDTPQVTPLSVTEVVPSTVADALLTADIPPTQSTDPLAQLFPALNTINEIELNIELAAQYIQLGAYAAARELLAENEAQYSIEQQKTVDELLEKIAS